MAGFDGYSEGLSPFAKSTSELLDRFANCHHERLLWVRDLLVVQENKSLTPPLTINCLLSN